LTLTRHQRYVRHGSSVATLLLLVLLGVWHFSAAPPTWYDEGVNLQAARNLARSGQYGLEYEPGKISLFDVQLTTGPTVIVPVSLVFKVWQVGLTQGRVVMLAFVLLAALGLYLVGRLLYSHAVGLLAVLVLCGMEAAAPSRVRDVVGEIAALAFTFWGLALLCLARGRGATWYMGAGLLLGLAVLSKGQFALLAPAVIGTWLVSRLALKPSSFTSVRSLAALLVSMALPIIGWQAYQLLSLGLAEFQAHLQGQSAAVSVSAGVPFLSATVSNAELLLSARLAVLALIAMLYVGLREARGLGERLILPGFAVLWLVWFLAFSVGYERYTVPWLTVCSLLVAVLAWDLGRISGSVLRGAALALVLLPVALGVIANLRSLAQPQNSFAREIATIISTDLDPSATTESLEWELDVLTEHPFHHPPPFVPHVPYSVPRTVRYLVDGPASKATLLYVNDKQQFVHIASAGPYDLYRRIPN
jgi:4-amino-4-deoxy-L-arabinose transferase-like glycosyltransferase